MDLDDEELKATRKLNGADKSKDLEFILAIKNSKSISDICSDLGIQYGNLINNKSSKENEKQVALLLKAEIIKMYKLIKEEN